MNRISFLLFVIAIIAIAGSAAWYLIETRNEAFGPTPSPTATSTPEVHEGLAIYTNGSYGFSIFYPEFADVVYPFDENHELGKRWRIHALADAAGIPVVAIIPYTIQQERAYPRSYNAMVRIGASSDPKEIERCLRRDETVGEIALPDKTIGGRIWKAFAFESAGMMQYEIGISYRILYEDRCIALEQVRTGSTYRENQRQDDIPEDVLLAEYEKLSSIIESFTFAR